MRKLLMLMTGIGLFACNVLYAQTREVTGKVTDATGLPIPGATINIKGTKRGTSAGTDGAFRLSVSSSTVLVISGVGFDTKEVTVGNQESIAVVLTQNNQALSEVVVTAFGVKKEKKALGYAVSTVNKEQLELRPEADLGRVLNGKAPGVNILSTSGLSGSGTNINIRGISTITGSSQPLFVVDGAPFNASTNDQADFTWGHQTSSRFLDLDPNNIENISILKGLSATVLYGEAGRNGVILITTKNGATAKTKSKQEISVSQSYFVTHAILPDYNTQYGGGFDLSLGIAFFSNWGAKFTNPPAVVKHPYDKTRLNAEFPQYKGAPYNYQFYNSVHNFFREGNSKNTFVNVSGSSGSNVNYNVNYSYTDDNGYIVGNGLVKNTFGMGGTAKLSNNFTVSGTVNYVTNDVKSPPTSNSYGNNASNTSIFGNVMYTPTAVDLMGLPYELPSNHSSIYYRNSNDIQNPRWILYNAFTRDKVSRVFGQMNFSYEFRKGFNIGYRVGYDNYTEYQEYSQNKGGTYLNTGLLRTSTGINSIWNNTLYLSYNQNLSHDLSLTVDAGGNKVVSNYSQNGMKSETQLVYGLMTHGNFVSHDDKSENGTPLNRVEKIIEEGVFAQAQLGYRDYAYLTLGGRNSWTSAVTPDNRRIFYPSATVSFIPTTAISSLQNSSSINFLKFRVGYSTSANFPPPYATQPFLYTSTRTFVTADGKAININAIPSQLANPNLKPELLKETEAGMEGRFLDNRLSLDFTAYRRVADNQILNRLLDPSTGYTSQQINAGTVTNKGIEALLGVTVIQKKNLRWQLEGLYTLNRSMVSDIPSYLPRINTAGYSNQGTFAINGYPLGVIMGSYIQRETKSGGKMISDDGNYVTGNDIKVIGDPNPLYKLTGISTLTFHTISFRMQWDFTEGGEMYSGTVGALLGRGVTKDTQFDRSAPYILPGVDAKGRPNTIQISATQAYYGNSITNGAPDETAIYDATCVRLREASLSYNIPPALLNKTPFGAVSFSISGTNLWYYAPNFPKYMHFDPEASGLGVGNGRGMEFLTGPSARRFGASIRVTF